MKHLILEALGGLVLAAAALVGYALWDSGSWGLVDIPPSRVAVRVDHAAGSAEVIEGPGYAFHLPFSQEVVLLDRQPQVFRMEGEKDQATAHERYLTVRAKDGSNFWFESMEISYRLLPGAAADVLRDSGEGGAFQRWIGAYARGILGDEFGRYEAQDVANLTESQSAKEEARRRLNEKLLPHGVEVVQITTPKPKFDRGYEKAIFDRKIANQEVEKLALQEAKLREEREQRLAKVDKEKAIELEALRGTLAEKRLNVRSKGIQLRGAADAYAIERGIAGESRKADLIALADGMRDKGAKEAEGLAAMVAAIASGGDTAVRMAFVERLASVSFRLSTPEKVPVGAFAVAKQ